jgi:hypothetical protein
MQITGGHYEKDENRHRRNAGAIEEKQYTEIFGTLF